MMRGQEEAPIELLIGVTILTFVLIIGFYTYQNACSAQFEQKMRSSLNSLAFAFQTVYKSPTGNTYPMTVDFRPEGCAGKVSEIQIVQGTTALCEAQLGHSDCLALAMYYIDETGVVDNNEMYLVVAMDVPSSVTVYRVKRDLTFDCADAYVLDSYLNSGPSSHPCPGMSLTIHSFTISKESPSEMKIIY